MIPARRPNLAPADEQPLSAPDLTGEPHLGDRRGGRSVGDLDPGIEGRGTMYAIGAPHFSIPGGRRETVGVPITGRDRAFLSPLVARTTKAALTG